jgi:hypothetical protein
MSNTTLDHDLVQALANVADWIRNNRFDEHVIIDRVLEVAVTVVDRVAAETESVDGKQTAREIARRIRALME